MGVKNVMALVLLQKPANYKSVQVQIRNYRLSSFVIYLKSNLKSSVANIFSVAGSSFKLGEKGKKVCPVGYEKISDREECREACNTLQIPPSNSFQNGKPCIKTGNIKCKQGNSIGSKAFIICEKIGKFLNIADVSK